jgi:hypothetical protein
MTAMAQTQDPAKLWLRVGPNKLLDTPEIIGEMDTAREFAGDDHSFLTLQRLQCNDIDDTYTVVGPPGVNKRWSRFFGQYIASLKWWAAPVHTAFSILGSVIR